MFNGGRGDVLDTGHNQPDVCIHGGKPSDVNYEKVNKMSKM